MAHLCVRSLLHYLPQLIIPVSSGLSFLASNSGGHHVESLARAREVNFEFPSALSGFKHFSHEPLHLFTDHQVLVPVEEGMGVKLDEDPIGPFLHADAGATPTREAIHRQRIILRQRPILDPGNRQTADATRPIKHQWPSKNYRQLKLVTNSQIFSRAMRPRVAERMTTLGDRGDARHLRLKRH